MGETFDAAQQRHAIHEAAGYLQQRWEQHTQQHTALKAPRVLVICGSGLGGISHRVQNDPPPLVVPYSDIPGFKMSTVVGHSGTLVFGHMSGTPVVLMNGRLHGYEGNSIWDTVFPIRVIHEMGHVRTLIVTNASGGINTEYEACDLMCISDHINIPGLSGLHPLKGPNLDEYGPRFLPLSDAYDLELRKLLFAKWRQLDLQRPLHEGTYAFVSGPTFESRAETRMLRYVGADCVGMSTVPEVIVARHCDWKVLALSLITNKCVADPPASALDQFPTPLDSGIASHSEVLENGRIASFDVEKLIEAVVDEL